jgi:serine/threonine protein kinase/Tol biopolymer transport system component
VTGGVVSHYELIELLSRQETGEVYKARDLHDGRDGRSVVVEVFPAPGDVRAADRLRQEAAAVAGLDHPHISPVLEVGETPDGRVFVARSQEDGETLGSRIERGALTPEHAVGLASQIAAALGRAHEKGIVHRDLRPANVLITGDGQVRVSGFGLAWLLPENGAAPESVAAWRSPELLRGKAEAVDARTDIWSLGVILYQMVTGRHPFRGGDRSDLRLDLMAAVLEREPEPMTTIHPGLPAELDDIVAHALSKDPAGRPARMDDFLVTLRGMLAGGGLNEVDSTVVQVPGLRSARSADEETETSPDLDSNPSTPSRSSRSSRPASAPRRRETVEMELAPGTSIAQYRILGLLGGGSMGTVFRAEDTRLRRTVALKFLSPQIGGDPMAKARFFQEAQAASALDHPNICTIHEVGETADGHLYLAMASYDGETVRARIARGPLPVAEALDIARQTALGLAKAHRNHIVHRDIKPANLVVTTDGVVKILDFGVAKLRGAGAVNVAGSFLGTPAYMSPEQARGEEVDSRADVWSLGVVLYEMLTGVRPFRGGDDLTAVLRALLEDRPEPLARLRPEVTPAVERVVSRMLARSPEERYPSAAEALADLNALLEAPASRRRRVWPWTAGIAAAAGVAGLAVWLALHRAPEPLQATFSRVTDEEGRELYPTLSPDGLSVAYVASEDGQTDIFLRSLKDARGDFLKAEPVNLTQDSPDEDTQPAFSPDGKRIAFRSEREGGGIWVIPAAGGTARRLTDFGYNPAWSPDGNEIAVATEGIVEPISRKMDSAIWIVDLATGRRRELLPKAHDGVQPSWSPKGLRIAYWGLPAEGARRILWTVSAGGSAGGAAGGNPVKTLDDGFLNWNPVWSPDGRYLYFGSDRAGSLNLWRLPIEESTGKVLGEAEMVTTPAMGSGFWSVSRSGRRLVYAANETKANVERYPFDEQTLKPTGPPTAITRGSHMIRSCEVSPDGRRIAYSGVAPREDLFLVNVDGTGQVQLTDDVFKDRHPFWSPDGRKLLFYSNRGGDYEAWILHLADRSMERVLPQGSKPLTFPNWSPDGRRIACTYDDRPAIVDLDEPLLRRRPRPLPPASALGESFYPTSWSKDGQRLAGNISRVDGSIFEGIGVYFLSSRTYLRWTSRGITPVWLRDDRRLLYTEAGKVLAFDSRTYETRDVLAPQPSSAYLAVSASPDGRSLFAVRAVEEGDIWLLSQDGDNQGS